MPLFIFRRTGQAVLVLFIVTLIVFFTLQFTGDPIEILMPPEATEEQVNQMREYYGLNKPILVQYGLFLANAVQGNLGVSFHHGQPATQLVLERLPATAELVFSAILLSLLFSIPIGVYVSTRRGSVADKSALLFSLIGISAPHFWVGIALIYIFSVELGWLPSSGRGGWLHLIMPAGSLAFYKLALFIRLLRAGMLDTMTQDYIRTAKAKGLSKTKVIYKHALKNTLIPFTTIAGIQMGGLLAGAVVTERIFAWPGMGRLFLDAVGVLDFPVIIAWSILTSGIFVVINLIVDILYVWLDPRIRHTQS